jgi:hypothetical protein
MKGLRRRFLVSLALALGTMLYALPASTGEEPYALVFSAGECKALSGQHFGDHDLNLNLKNSCASGTQKGPEDCVGNPRDC